MHDHNHHDHKHEDKQAGGFNINVESAFLHVMGDMLMSVGVIIASVVIYKWP